MSELVLACLAQAASQDPDTIRQAEQRLKEWEIEPGFYTTLLNIYSDHRQQYHHIDVRKLNKSDHAVMRLVTYEKLKRLLHRIS